MPPLHLPLRIQQSLDYRIESRRWNKRAFGAVEAVDVGSATTIFVDVFDTVLSRRILGHEPAVDVVARDLGETYRRLRLEAAAHFDRLDHICGWVATELGDVDERTLLALEERAEAALSSPIPGAADWLAKLRRADKQIVFVSDMHLSPTVIGELLRTHHLLEDSDQLVVSSDWGSTKRSGALLELVLDKLGLDPSEVVHVGNDLVTDGVMPRRIGIDVMPAATGNPTRFEQIASDYGPRTGGVSAVVGGAARRARLKRQHEDSASNRKLIEVATGVGGIVGVVFALWVLRRARELGIERLVFVARDGEILMRIAEALPGGYTEGIELRYLHANRRTVALAQAAREGVEEWIERGVASDTSRLLDGRSRVPYRNLCERVGLNPGQLANLVPALEDIPADEPLPEARVNLFIAALRDRSVQAEITRAAQSRANLVADYFSQMGLAESGTGLVDVGWTGQLAEAIGQIAQPYDEGEPISFHLGSIPTSPAPRARIEALIDERKAGIDGLVVCVETFTASGAPPVVGFERLVDDLVKPVFGGTPSVDPARATLHNAMVETARQMPDAGQFAAWADLKSTSVEELLSALLGTLWQHPTRAEATALAALLFESDDAGRVVSSLVQPIRPGRKSARRPWGAGSIAISSLPVRVVGFARQELRKRC
ncbi:MAG: HAD family hydrolase [Acidimicrobiales bacterium]